MPRITVGIRLRPLHSEESIAKATEDANNGVSYNEDSKSVEVNISGIKHDFTFDKLYNEKSSQLQVFNSCTSPMYDVV